MAGEIVFRPTREDYIAVARGSFRRGLSKPRFRVRLIIGVLIGAVIGAVVSMLDTGMVRPVPVLMMAGVMAVWLAILLIVLYLLIPRRSGRLFTQQRTLGHEFTLSWDEKGMTQRWEHGTVHTAWRDYHEQFENQAVIALGLNERLFSFAPKRVMSAEQIADLRAMAAGIS